MKIINIGILAHVDAGKTAGRLPLQGGRVTAVTVVTAVLGYPLLLSLTLKAM